MVQIAISTPLGSLNILAEIAIAGRTLTLRKAHIDGLRPGSLGRAGLNAIGRKLLEVADVDEIIVQGARRTSGRRKGTVPS
ncbi:MAG: hypothetical protein ACK4ZN_14170, partial [Oceanibaculum sp.]